MKPPDEAARPTAKQDALKGILPTTGWAHRTAKSNPLNTAIGNPNLCAWQPMPGITWVQSRSALFARKLAQQGDSRLVMRGVAGGFLRTFEFRHRLAWAFRLINRYTRNLEATNAPKTTQISVSGDFGDVANVWGGGKSYDGA